MDTLFAASKHTHMLAVLLLVIAQGAYFWIEKADFVTFVKKLRLLLLVQNVFIGMVVFTGLLMMGVMQFKVWNLEIVLMIFVMVGVIVHQILINKKRKPIRSDEVVLQENYKKWVRRVYGAEIAAEVVVFVLAMILK